MDKTTFTYLLQHPENLSEKDILSLQTLLKNYPYIQCVRALLLKTFSKTADPLYQTALAQTAAYTADRSVLFEYIASEKISPIPPSEQEPEKLRPVTEIFRENSFLPNEKEAEAVLNPQLFLPKNTLPTEAENLPEKSAAPQKPVEFSTRGRHSFSEWLKLTSPQTLQHSTSPAQAVPVSTLKKEKFERIDKFIAENPKIIPRKEETTLSLPQNPLPFEKNELMTETLAKVYVEQRKYKEAIQAYKILSLKYPEKSGFFADQMKAIKKLQQNNDIP